MLSLLRFARYARAFEKTVDDDDWERVKPFFRADAVYEVDDHRWGCCLEGPDAICAGIRKSLDGFDRKFPRRSPRLTGLPRLGWNRLRIGWSVTYKHEQWQPFVLVGASQVVYRGGQILRITDTFAHHTGTNLDEWCAANGVELDPSYS